MFLLFLFLSFSVEIVLKLYLVLQCIICSWLKNEKKLKFCLVSTFFVDNLTLETSLECIFATKQESSN